MKRKQTEFLLASGRKVFDLDHRKKLNFALKQADAAYKKGKQQFSDLETTKKIAKNIKWQAIENLHTYLEAFETNFNRNGGRVIWAEDTQQALDAILNVCRKNEAKSIVKSKSIVTEEIHLNQFLTKHHIEILETDLGEYIQQLDGEAPYHIVAPSLHKSKEDVAQLFHEKLNVPPDLSPEELTLVARNILRKKYAAAEIGITGINFILADIGGIAITENEGNAWLSASAPKIHIAITGIEKILPSVHDLNLFWPLLATHGSGQRTTVYNSIYTGPKKQDETDGPEEMYVILLDNRRSHLLADPAARESLYCIRCGACLNVCPVYKNIGGHTYGTTYSGPIGAVISPYLNDAAEYQHLSFASSLCGACTEVCPVHINLHNLLLNNRRNAVEQNLISASEQIGWKIWKKINQHRLLMNWPGGATKTFLVGKLFRQHWGIRRILPEFTHKTFNQFTKNKPDSK
ncbi:LutB/LldF family L-lactate oxidation iron-sulfur protein [Dyadobacter sp. LHD-138]|uniref:LutB/LldF family L-lactate oxidation iron-sulfur protein n=1 Tax=Dyadobacter sp. LHD-138 TaxID=3071413 RepID=UPI0027DFFA28|nr:LutB/LldF family L-lactate oxidation iron-sulfur protein [Dyadobacter sp. LHD-138]MDQ6480648.1 LutB/LldF family L-lactate oxidation iron-sulfur protein [Dyadobacter sp. LHD-138]